MAIEEITTGNQGSSPDLIAENVKALKELFPEIVGDGKVNTHVLLQLLGNEANDSDERFGLSWHGKRRARQLALTPSTGALRPAPEDSVDWDDTRHLMIDGDNLEVLKLLQKSYAGRVKLIYIDPPYNTGDDFIYEDDFRDGIGNYLRATGQSEDGKPTTTNPESSGRFHTTWLNMMYPRLHLARHLLADDGLVFVSCNQTEAPNLSQLLRAVFGEENQVSDVVWKKSYGGGSKKKHVVGLHDYVFCFAKSKDSLGRLELPPRPEALKYYKYKDSKHETRGPYRLQPLATTSMDERSNLRYPIPFHGEKIWPEKQWQWSQERTMKALKNDDIVIEESEDGWSVNYKQYLRDEEGNERGAKPYSIVEGPYTQSGTKEIRDLFGDPKVFPFPKPVDLIRHFVEYAHPSREFIVVDFFAGSGTTGHAVMAQNVEDGGDRRYILVQLPEPLDPENKDQKVAAEFCDKIGKPRNIAELTKERLRRAADKIREEHPDYDGDLGFRVFKLDSSNIRAWDPQPEDLENTLLEHVDHLKEDRSEQDVLYELLLKLGLDLCVPIETNTIANKTVHSIGAGTLFACLDETIKADTIEDLALGIVKWRDTLDPAGDTTVVFRDSAFPDDVTKTNLDAILKQHNITTVRSI